MQLGYACLLYIKEALMPTITDKIIRISLLTERLSLSKSTIYRLISQGDFPRPIPLGSRSVGWLESSINEWLASRKSEEA